MHCFISFVIRNIPHDTKVIDINIKAVNELKVVGEEAKLLEAKMTTAGSEYKKCLFEIQRVESLKSDLVDTDFYNVIHSMSNKIFIHRNLAYVECYTTDEASRSVNTTETRF